MHYFIKRKAVTLLLCAMSLIAMAQSQLAFPGAQGWGRYAQGGRNGQVYHVTNLNDSGTGSLRDAVSQKNRIIVFDVSGCIKLNSRLVFQPNLYVAGQTAPGEGITVYGNGVSFSGASNIIVRHMKFRMGHNGDSGKDCAGIANGSNMIFDHCSFSWGLDETFSINPSSGATCENITLSNCIFGQGLMSHSAGGLIQTDFVTLYRNLYVDNSTRNNKVKGKSQYVNNMVYNWSNGAYIMGGDSEGSSYVNIEGCLFVNGPSKGGEAFTGANADFHVYGNDNWQDKDMNGVLAPYEITNYSASTRVSTPYDYPELEKWPGKTLNEYLLPEVGASLPYRDPSDYYMIDEVMSWGKKGALISNEETLSCGAPSTWTFWQGAKATDTDGDGMPDWWEDANGTNKTADDAMTKASNGYVNIENYINSITWQTVEEHQFFLRTPYTFKADKTTQTSIVLSWADYTRNEEGFIIEMQKDGEWKELARTDADVQSYTISNGLQPGTPYIIRICAYAGDTKSEYSPELTAKTKPLQADIVDCDTYEPDLTWKSAAGFWNFTTETAWTDNTGANAKYEDGKKVLFDRNATTTVAFTQGVSVAPQTIVVKGTGKVTLKGSSAKITGTTSLNKTGEGELVIESTENDYTGATVVHGGTLSVASLKDGGVASSIGASQEFAQNLILDGGTLNYTGGSTKTNRWIQLADESAIAVATSSSVLTMNGQVEGESNLVIDGKGQVSVGTTNFFQYTGNTILKGGSLYLSTTEVAKAGIGKSPKLIMNGGHLKTKGESAGYETYSFPMEIAEGAVSQFSPNRNCYWTSKVTGYGTLQWNIPYLREYVQGDYSKFYGRIIANSSYSESSTVAGLFLINNVSNDFPNAVVELKGTTILAGWTTNMTIELGGLAGEATTKVYGSSKNTKGFECNYIIGGASTDEEFKGNIYNYASGGNSAYTGTINITKKGNGIWRFSGTSIHGGTTAVSGGQLIVNGKITGTGAVTVNQNATLAGKGSVAGNVTVKDGAIIQAGDTLVDGSKLTMTGTCQLQKGATLLLKADGAGQCNTIATTGTLTISDATLEVDVENGAILPTGTAMQVFTAGTVAGTGFTNIVPAQPSATQAWDTTELMTKGVIKVVDADPDGIYSVMGDTAHASARRYNMQGQAVGTDTYGLLIENGRKVIKRP